MAGWLEKRESDKRSDDRVTGGRDMQGKDNKSSVIVMVQKVMAGWMEKGKKGDSEVTAG